MSLQSNACTGSGMSLGRSLPRVLTFLVVVPLLTALALMATARSASAQAGELTIEKSTNGVDADSAPGPVLTPGSAVSWTYVVTITGQTTLFDLIVTDTSGVVPNCDVNGDGNGDGTNIHPGPLENGQSFRCTAGGTVHGADNGVYASTANVRAIDFSGATQFEDQDPSHYTPVVPFVADPRVSIQSLVNGSDADASPGPYIAEGSPVIWTYVVTNSGNVPLTSLAISNSAGLDVNCGATANVIAGPLAPGASVTCTSTANAVTSAAGLQTNSGTVQANAVDPGTGNSLRQLTATDPLNYTPVELPGALAFTGPSGPVAPIGAALAALGMALWVIGWSLGRRSSTEPAPALDIDIDPIG